MLRYENSKLYELFLEILCSLRKNVIKDRMIPSQEIYLAIACLLKINDELPKLKTMNDDESYAFLIDAYSRDNRLSHIFETVNYYTIPNFEFLIKHLRSVSLLHEIILDISRIIEKKIEKNEWSSLKRDIIFSSYDDYLPEDIIITRGNDGTFASRGEYDNALENSNLYLDIYNGYPTHPKVYHDNVVCIWPFSNGYARVIGKDGRWGYLSQEDNIIRWLVFNIKYICDLKGKITGVDLKDSVLYADDFKCERARVQLDDERKSFMYLGLCLDDCFGKTFKEASEFKNGYAIVSDEYCDNYTIDVFGEIIDADKKRYEDCRTEIEELEEQKKRMRGRKRFGIYDPESEIMRSLSGHGSDPELFGF